MTTAFQKAPSSVFRYKIQGERAGRTPAEGFVAMLDVEVDLVRDLGALCGLDALRAEECRDGDEEEAQRETAEYHFVGVEGRSEAQSRQRSTEEVAKVGLT